MYEDMIELVQNHHYLNALNAESAPKTDILKIVPSFESLAQYVKKLQADDRLTFATIFHEPIGYYLIKCFLTSEYSVAKAIFIADVESYRRITDDRVRLKIAMLIFDQYVAERSGDAQVTRSVFEMDKAQVALPMRTPMVKAHDPAVDAPTRLPIDAAANPKGPSRESTHEPAANSDPMVIGNRIDSGDGSKPGSVESGADVLTTKKHPELSVQRSAERSPRGDLDATDPIAAPGLLPSVEGQVADKAIVPAAKLTAPLVKGTSLSLHTIPEAVVALSHRASMSLTEMTKRIHLQIGSTNAIGVYGAPLKAVATALGTGVVPNTLFDAIANEVLTDLQFDAFPRFLASEFFEKYVRVKSLETKPVSITDFHMMRMLGLGAFGAVNACYKVDTGKMYASKCIDKRRVMGTKATKYIMSERNLLAMMDCKFVCCLKYAVEDEGSVYLMLDLMMGGDLRYHLNREKKFDEDAARYIAGEILLGLEHIHSKSIVYRDLKLENVLLDDKGHCKISDLGLAVLTQTTLRGYAGTPGYTAPEVIKEQQYDRVCDWFSYGALVYRLLAGKGPFSGKPGEVVDRDPDQNVLKLTPEYKDDVFGAAAKDFVKALLEKDPAKRLGANGAAEVKQHPWFAALDWGLLENGHIKPLFVPPANEVNAASMLGVNGPEDNDKYKKLKLTKEFQDSLAGFPYQSDRALQQELVEIMQHFDEGTNFEKFAPVQKVNEESVDTPNICCVLM